MKIKINPTTAIIIFYFLLNSLCAFLFYLCFFNHCLFNLFIIETIVNDEKCCLNFFIKYLCFYIQRINYRPVLFLLNQASALLKYEFLGKALGCPLVTRHKKESFLLFSVPTFSYVVGSIFLIPQA
jgi:hypothetical protein